MNTSERIRLGLCSISALDRPLEAAAALAATHGLDGLEVTVRPPHLDPGAADDTLRDAGRSVRDAGVDVIAYGSYLGRSDSLGGAAVAAREAWVAALVETPLLRVWADCVADAADAGFADIVATLQVACDTAADAGIAVVVERHIGSFADTPERIDQIFEAVSRPNSGLNYQVVDFLPQRLAAAQPDDARRLVPRALLPPEELPAGTRDARGDRTRSKAGGGMSADETDLAAAWARLHAGRRVHGIAAALLPYTPGGRIDSDG